MSCLIGYDIGAAVGAALVAKFNTVVPRRFSRLCLLSPVGVMDSAYCLQGIESLRTPFIGEIYMKLMNKKAFAANEEKSSYFRCGQDQYHYGAICKASRMLKYQWDHTPGYRGALLSTVRDFSFNNLGELYRSIGRQSQTLISVCVIIGKRDALIPSVANAENDLNDIFHCHEDVVEQDNKSVDSCESGKKQIAASRVSCLECCGHHVLFEQFDEVVEILIEYVNDTGYRYRR